MRKRTRRPLPVQTEEMEFYTEALWGGDSLFSFGDNGGFENYSKTASTGKTELTKISELTTLYKLKMPTNTPGLGIPKQQKHLCQRHKFLLGYNYKSERRGAAHRFDLP